MPRNSSGTYSLPVAAFAPGGLIKSSDLNSNYSDIATALTQSLATTGVSTMTGPIKAAAGALNGPSITFSGALTTGFYLSATNQIGWASNGVQGATFNADTSVTWAGGATWGGTISANKGTIPIGAVVDFAGAAAPAGWLLCFGQLVSQSTYANLFTALGTLYGSGSGTFGIPDYRGRVTIGQDNMGGSAAGRISVSGGNYDGTVLGNSGGSQNEIIAQNQLPNISPTFTGTPNQPISVSSNGIGVGQVNPGTGTTNVFIVQGSGGAGTASGSFTATGTISSINGNVTQHITPTLDPSIITNKIIYAGV